jgi:hypothetical protein
MEFLGAAPVPPSKEETRITWAPALATPAATVPTPCFGNQFNRNPGIGIGIFQVINQLGQILNGINIMVSRRRNKTYASGRMPGFGNPWIYLLPRKLASFSRLRTLCHFNLGSLWH